MRLTKYTLEYDDKRLPALVKESSVNYGEPNLDNPRKIVEMLNLVYHLNGKTEEYLYLVALNAKSVPVGIFEVSHGGISETMSYPREIFKRVFLCNAECFVLAHNHPSRDVHPSVADVNNFKRVLEASKIMGANMADYIILGAFDNYCSFREYGHFNNWEEF